MGRYFSGQMEAYRKQLLGLAFMLGWVYFSFFSCGLVPVIRVLRSSERYWMWTGLLLAVASVVIVLLSVRRPLAQSRAFGVLAALFASGGTVVIWASFFSETLYQPLSAAGGMLAGVGFAMMAQVWGNRMSRHDEAAIEFAAPASFIVAFCLYFLLLALKGPLSMIADALFPVLSMVLAFRKDGRTEQQGEGSGEGAAGAGTAAGAAEGGLRLGCGGLVRGLAGIATLCLLSGLLWSQFAYFRLLATPDAVGDRFLHYLVPFSLSFILSIAVLLSCIKLSRYLNFTLMFRWALPFMLLSYALLYLNYDDPLVRIAAYAMNFVGMFGVQFSLWVAAPKYVRRTGIPSYLLFGSMLAAEGVGIFAGAGYGLSVIDGVTAQNVMNESLLFFVGLLFVTMVVGFNPNWAFSRLGRQWPKPVPQSVTADVAGDAALADDIDALFEQQAEELRETYGLSQRETEVAALLLAGRSRPYIRDELVISLNTVHSHVSSIYTKCGVHSQQEFMDLLRPLS